MKNQLTIDASVERLGVILEPSGDPSEVEGVLNPASAVDRKGTLLLYPRSVAAGNVSRVGLVRVNRRRGKLTCERLGFALQPEGEHETGREGGYGTEDPRVTFVPAIDRYVMAYTATGIHDGQPGCRIAFAISKDAYNWQRIGLAQFPAHLALPVNDKDAAFFPEPVLSPQGVLSLAFYHRPMAGNPPQPGESWIDAVLREEPCNRESVRIAYVPLEPVLEDIANLSQVAESVLVMCPDGEWGTVKLGGGSPPLRIRSGCISLYHGIDPVRHEDGRTTPRYSAGIVIHDANQPHQILYRSPAPLMSPETADELSGIVNNVVFPTAMERTGGRKRVFDVYYGMADSKIGLARLRLNSVRKSR